MQTDQFIATQLPLSDTIVSFWSMVYDLKCRSIVMCNQYEQVIMLCKSELQWFIVRSMLRFLWEGGVAGDSNSLAF